ncbi:hypothetical protein JCM14469_23660 [Desulfatiferula olefinivorans]
MVKAFMVSAALCGFVFILPAYSATAPEPWELIRDTDGISTYTQSVEGSDYDAFKAVTTLPVNMAQVGAVFRDIAAYPQWMANVSEAVILKRYNENDMDLYFVLNFPWPTHDRDTVLASRTTVDPVTGRVNIVTTDIPDANVPEKEGLVRIPRLVQTFTMDYVDVNLTEVSYSVHMNAGGKLPVAAVQMDLKKAPSKSLNNLKTFVLQDTYMAADPMDDVNIGITKTILGLNLKKYNINDTLIKRILDDRDAIARLVANGHSPESRKKNIAIIAGVYLRTPEFAALMDKIDAAGLLPRLMANDVLLDQLSQNPMFTDIIMTSAMKGYRDGGTDGDAMAQALHMIRDGL